MIEASHDTQRGYERNIIAGMLNSLDVASKVFETITAEDFYFPEYRTLYRAIEQCIKEHDQVDQLLVMEALGPKALENIGGEAALMGILDEKTSPALTDTFCNRLKDYSARHRAEKMIAEHVKALHDPLMPIEDTLSRISEGAASIMIEKKSRPYVNEDELMQAAYAETVRRYENRGKTLGIPTGIKALDNTTSGFQPGQLIVLAGKTSQGKTALALNILANAAKTDYPVAIFTLEMPWLEIGMRLLSNESRYNTFDTHKVGTEEPPFTRMSDAANRITQCAISVCDTPGLSLPRFAAILRRLVRERGVKLAVVDYLQLMEGTNRESRTLEVTSISRGLKRYAKQFGIPILALSQFSRKIDEQDRPPKLSDLRESGAIEQDADVVMAIYAPKYDDVVKEPGMANLVQGQERDYRHLLVLKNRNGQIGKILIHWTGEYMRFDDVEINESGRCGNNRTTTHQNQDIGDREQLPYREQ